MIFEDIQKDISDRKAKRTGRLKLLSDYLSNYYRITRLMKSQMIAAREMNDRELYEESRERFTQALEQIEVTEKRISSDTTAPLYTDEEQETMVLEIKNCLHMESVADAEKVLRALEELPP